MWDYLEKAAERAVAFKQKLSESDGFGLSQGFGKLSQHAKPISLAVIMAAGASGCSTVNLVGNHGELRTQAEQLERMAPELLVEHASQRRADNPDYMDSMGVREIAQAITQNGGVANLGKGVAVDNPFMPGQSVEMINANDVNGHVQMAAKNGVSISAITAAATGQGSFTYNPNVPSSDITTKGGRSNLNEQAARSYIFLDSSMRAGEQWTYGKKPEQDVAFNLYNELARTHITHEMAAYLNQSPMDTLRQKQEEFVEAQAHVVGTLMTAVEYDLSADELKTMINSERNIATQKMVLGEVLDSPIHEYLDLKIGDREIARPQNAYIALSSMLDKHPDLLDTLEGPEVPIMAYDLVRQAGYPHNNAEVILENVLPGVPHVTEPTGRHYDELLGRYLKEAFPDSTTFGHNVLAMNTAWDQYQSAERIQAVATGIEENIAGADTRGEAYQLIQRADYAADNRGRTVETLEEAIEARRAQIQTGRETVEDALQGLVGDMRHIADQMPDLADVDDVRQSALANIRDELVHQHQATMDSSNDSSAYFAQGSGRSPNEVAGYLLDRYGVGEFGDDQSVAAGLR